jgi:hypothetical protein
MTVYVIQAEPTRTEALHVPQDSPYPALRRISASPSVGFARRRSCRWPRFWSFALGVGANAARLIVGSGVSLWVSLFVASLLYGLGPQDPATLVGAGITRVVVAALAGWVPRVSRVADRSRASAPRERRNGRHHRSSILARSR